MENQWLKWAKRLHALASTGLHYTESEYDRERYREIADITMSMMAEIGQTPLEHISALFPDFAAGYATPKVDVRGAIIQEDKILLVQEKNDKLWTLPGGYAEVGITMSSNVAKEVLEEASVNVKVERLYTIRHKSRHPYHPDYLDFYKFFFLCTPTGNDIPAPGPETMDVGFFSPDALPPLSTNRVLESDIHDAFKYHRNPALQLNFD